AGLAQPPAQAQQQAQWQSIRDAAAQYGHVFGPDVQDDQAALVQLLQIARQNRQADYHAQLGRQLLPHADQIRDFLGQQRQAQQAPAAPRPWEAPEFDQRWLALVDRDQATGLYVAKPGVQHEIAAKLNRFVEWKTEFDRNPGAVLNGMVEERARAI